eukprot:COSAG02_NODE_43017_length_379_cov_0.517857_1_plen_41_part_01
MAGSSYLYPLASCDGECPVQVAVACKCQHVAAAVPAPRKID